PGMILSNEPGFYKAGEFGIRIENLIVVTPATPVDGGEREMMSFETITLAPIDLKLVKAELLTTAERQWLNDYHAHVRKTLAPLVPSEISNWFENATRAI
ncbi:MAG: M24 family metallopeptidase C-terminal domain-containing protein, partial [Marinicaulis sp.]|nr:M24 family metallopeptidase C-terminal domain-containing protein [Marinicaulis sp.]